jgi:hypothetical protein
MFAHPLVVKGDCRQINYQPTTFEELFVNIKTYYYQPTATIAEKELILNYTFKIYEEYMIKGNIAYQAKFRTFESIIKERHLEFGKLLNTLDDQDKDMICKIFRMKHHFKELNTLISNYNIVEVLAIVKRFDKDIK